jgi:hypothetical protein
MIGTTTIALELVHELWQAHQGGCRCYCTSPRMPMHGDPHMPCDVYSVQLWCLTEEHYVKCCLWPAGDVP